MSAREDPPTSGFRNPEPGTGQVTDVPVTVAAAAARLGVAASTLRTWDRRYGLGASAHEAGRHRRYTSTDIARLETMRRLTLEGAAPADAARIALEGSASQAPHDVSGEAAVDLPVTIDPLTLAAAAVEPRGERPERLLIKAAMQDGLLPTWTNLVEPARELLDGQSVASGRRPGADPIVVLEAAFLAAVRSVSSGLSPDGATTPVIAASTERMRAHVMAGVLLEHGVRARVYVVRQLSETDASHLLAEAGPSGVLALVGPPQGWQVLADQAAGDTRVEIFALSDHDMSGSASAGVQRLRTIAATIAEIRHTLRV